MFEKHETYKNNIFGVPGERYTTNSALVHTQQSF